MMGGMDDRDVPALLADIALLRAERDYLERDRDLINDEWHRQTTKLEAIKTALGEADCPHGFAAGEPGCDCLTCRVRAAINA